MSHKRWFGRSPPRRRASYPVQAIGLLLGREPRRHHPEPLRSSWSRHSMTPPTASSLLCSHLLTSLFPCRLSYDVSKLRIQRKVTLRVFVKVLKKRGGLDLLNRSSHRPPSLCSPPGGGGERKQAKEGKDCETWNEKTRPLMLVFWKCL